MSGNNLSVRISADITDAATKFATMKAETGALASEFNKLARASVGGGLDPAAQQRYQQLAGDVAVAKARLAEMSQQMKATSAASAGLGGAFDDVRSKLSKAFAVTGLAVAAEGVMRLGEAVTELGDRAIEIRSMSAVLGVTTDQFQAMAVAGDEAGVSAQVFARASEHLTNLLSEARDGSGKAVEKLHALGITTGDIANKSFQLNDALAVLKQRLEDTNSAEETRKALLQDLGAKTALAIEAIKAYDGSQKGVSDAMSKVNGLSEEQIDRLAKMKTAWSELATSASNAGSKILAAAGNALDAYKKAVLAHNPQLAPEVTSQPTSGSVSGVIDRSGAPPAADSQAAQASARAQEAAHNEVLQHEMESIKQGVAAFESGTAERLAALRQYAALAKQYYGSGNVDEVRKANSEVLVAEREYRATQGREAIEDARSQSQALQANTTQTLAQRLDAERAIWTAVLANDHVAGAQRLEAAREFSREYTEIEKQMAVQASAVTRSDVQTDLAISKIELDAKRSALEQEVSANQIAAAQKLEGLRLFAAESFNLDLQMLESEMSTLQQGTSEYERVYNQIRELKAKLTADLEGYDSQYARDLAKQLKEQDTLWKGTVAEIENAESSLVSNILGGRKTLAQSLQQVGLQMLTQELSNDLKALTSKVLLSNQEKGVEQGGLLMHLKFNQTKVAADVQSQAAQTQAQAAGDAARLTQQSSAAVASKAVSAATGGPQVMADAARAAAGAYSAVAGVPYIGPILAPIAAGVAYSAVSAYEGLASLDTGTNYVVRGGLAEIHEGEAVVPKEYNPAAGGRGFGGDDEGDRGYHESHHYNGNVNIRAMDTAGIRSILKGQRNRHEIMQAGRKYISRGGGRR